MYGTVTVSASTPFRKEESSSRSSYPTIDESEFRLSPAEVRVLALVTDGLSYTEIGQRLGKSKYTIQQQLASARAKLGARTSVEALMIAFRDELIPCPRRCLHHIQQFGGTA